MSIYNIAKVDCGAPPVVLNAHFLAGDTDYGTSVEYTCNTGYRSNNTMITSCQLNKTWSLPTPSCSIVNCGDPGAPVNGYTNGSVFTYQSIVQYYCNEGYQLSGGSSAQCTATGHWNVLRPNCALVTCADPGIPANGVRIGNDFSYNSSVSFSCYPGYQLSGSGAITCDTEGNWNSTNLPSCDIIYCSAPVVPANGNVSYTSLSVNSSVYFTCNTGYTLIGESEIHCSDSGNWSHSNQFCRGMHTVILSVV